MSTRLQRLLCVVLVAGWTAGSTACGDDDPTESGSVGEEDASVEDASVSEGAGRGGRGGSSARAGRGGGGSGGEDEGGGAGGAEARGGTGGSEERGGAGGRGGSGGASAASGSGGGGGSGPAAGSGGSSGAGGSTASSDAGVQLSDAEIIAVTTAVNAGEIEAGNTALSRAQLEPTRAFAQMMVTMHTMTQERQSALAMMLGLSPVENAISRMLIEQTQAIRTRLDEASPEEFDRIYAETQVEAHAKVLMIIDDILLPSVMNPELRAELMTTRMSVENHLAEARELLEDVGEPGGEDAGL